MSSTDKPEDDFADESEDDSADEPEDDFADESENDSADESEDDFTEVYIPGNQGLGIGALNAPFQKGDIIDNKYEIVQYLGSGGIGVVYKVKNLLLRSDKFFALKVLHSHFCDDPERKDQFRQEWLMATEFSHQHALQLREYGETEDGYQYFSMDYSPGIPLEHLVQQPLPENRALAIARQVLEVLMSAHRKGIVHRDLKPGNILIEKRHGEDHALVLDFGIAKTIDIHTNPFMGQENIGTPQYVSPEQASGEEVGPLSDLYTMGIILYQMVTANLPFKIQSALEVLTVRLLQDPTPCSQWKPDISPALEKIIHKAIEKEPQDRFQSAAEFISAIDSISSPPLSALKTQRRIPAVKRSSLKNITEGQDFLYTSNTKRRSLDSVSYADYKVELPEVSGAITTPSSRPQEKHRPIPKPRTFLVVLLIWLSPVIGVLFLDAANYALDYSGAMLWVDQLLTQYNMQILTNKYMELRCLYTSFLLQIPWYSDQPLQFLLFSLSLYSLLFAWWFLNTFTIIPRQYRKINVFQFMFPLLIPVFNVYWALRMLFIFSNAVDDWYQSLENTMVYQSRGMLPLLAFLILLFPLGTAIAISFIVPFWIFSSNNNKNFALLIVRQKILREFPENKSFAPQIAFMGFLVSLVAIVLSLFFLDHKTQIMKTIAQTYEQDKEIEPNYQAALLWYERAAKLEDFGAMFYTAKMYDAGVGTEKNQETAKFWYKKSAAVDQWVVAMNNGPQMHEQISQISLEDLRKKIKEREIISISYLDGKWHFITKPQKTLQKIYQKETLFSIAQIEKQIQQGFYPTNLRYANNSWTLVLTKTENPMLFFLEPSFPEKKIEEGYQQGYIISSLSYEKDVWVLLMVKSSEKKQIWMAGSYFPKEQIDRYYRENSHHITHLSYGDGMWIVVMTQTTGQKSWQLYKSLPKNDDNRLRINALYKIPSTEKFNPVKDLMLGRN